MTKKSNIYIGRQPIYNANLGVFAYELLFRSGDTDNVSASDKSGDEATSQVVINTFLEMGLENLVGTRNACINLGENYLLWENIPRIMPERVILDIPENLKINEASVNVVKDLKKAGFKLAVNDFTNRPEMAQLINYIDIIRINVMDLEYEITKKHVAQLKKYNKAMLAEKIEHLDDYDLYTSLGFTYFQGYFLSHPKIVKSQSISNNRLSVMNLIATINNPRHNVDQLEGIINKDIGLSYKILKLVNSALFGLSSKVESIKHCIVLLGRRQLISWATMMAMSNLDDRPHEMLHISLIRAKTCELLAKYSRASSEDCYFTVGLLSALDILMQQPIKQLVKNLPLSDEVRDALVYRKGDMGEALNSAIAFELSEWEKVKFKNLEKVDLVKVNLEAYRWANEITRNLR